MAKRRNHKNSNLTRKTGVREIKQSFLIVCEGEKTSTTVHRLVQELNKFL